jgi:hypothetical protein
MEEGDRQLQDLNNMTVVELKKKAKSMGLSGYSKLKKAELIHMIRKNMRSRSRSPSPKRSLPKRTETGLLGVAKKDGKGKEEKRSSEEWRGLGQMSVLPVEMMDKIYKELSPRDKAQMLQTNKLLKTLMGGKVPEKEKKQYIGKKEGKKKLLKNIVKILHADADQYKIPYLGLIPRTSSVLVPKLIIDLLEVEEALKRGLIVPAKGRNDTIAKLIKYVNSYTYKRTPNRFKIRSNVTKAKKIIEVLMTDDIVDELTEYYINLLERIENRLP